MMSHSAARAVEEIVRTTFRDSIQVKSLVLAEQTATIARVAVALVHALRVGRKVLLCGNGGSAADAQHVASELINRFWMDREALPAIALTADTSVLTAVANDSAFDQVFERQVRALASEGDVVVGISTSGNAPNVLNAVKTAREQGAVTVGFSGRTGGYLKEWVDICFCVPSDCAPCVQEAHITAWHAICAVVEQELFGA
jgi:D-sedoheptulose 7-phosphate isomerase